MFHCKSCIFRAYRNFRVYKNQGFISQQASMLKNVLLGSTSNYADSESLEYALLPCEGPVFVSHIFASFIISTLCLCLVNFLSKLENFETLHP